MSIIELKNVNKSYFDASKKLQVLNNIDIKIEEGEFVAITGASGCGKSTLLHIMGLLDSADSGTIKVDEIDSKLVKSIEIFRNRNIGYIFQFHYLLEDFTALENVIIPLLVQKVKKNDAIVRAKKILSELGLEDRIYHYPKQLSGGEEQRVAIARAIVTDPKILIADEPTGNLDKDSSKMVVDILRDLNNKGLTVIFVTHDLSLVRSNDTHYTIESGKIITYK